MGKRRPAECAYCGTVTQVTREHVIPKCLFIQPHPPNLVTVPVCQPCNNSKSRNDDFLRDWLTADLFGSQSPEAQSIFNDKVLSSVRQGSSEVGRRLITEAKTIPFITKNGIYLGEVESISLDEERVNDIFTTIIQGLYYYKYKIRMPDGLKFTIRGQYLWNYKKAFDVLMSIGAQPLQSFGDVFSFTHMLGERPIFEMNNKPIFFSMWMLVFYRRVIFTVSAVDPQFHEYRIQRGLELNKAVIRTRTV